MLNNRPHSMRVIRNLTPPPNGDSLAATIGNFDGVHLGHQSLIQNVQQNCENNMASAVITFEPHPLKYLQPQTQLLQIYPWRNKYEQINKWGIDFLYVIRFSHTLAKMAANDFATLLFHTLRIRYLTVGSNFSYGNGAKGDIALLQQTAEKYNAIVEAHPLLKTDNTTISSGQIRYYLQQGDIIHANRLLGHPFTLTGRVIQGSKIGRQWQVPTANLATTIYPPCHGVFCAYAYIDNRRYIAAVSIGMNPTVKDDNKLRVEAHLLDFSDNIYEKRITLEFVEKLRDEENFASINALKNAISSDIQKTRAILKP